MKIRILLFAFFASASVMAQQTQQFNDSFKVGAGNGDVYMRRYEIGDTKWKRALVPLWDSSLTINHGGDFTKGVRIMGSQLAVDGNVGIGTERPSSKLDINAISYAGNQDGGINLKAQRLDVDIWNVGLKMKSSSTGAPRFAITSTTKNTSNEVTSDKEALSVLFNGNVGIGTIAPQQKFHVTGRGLFEGDVEIRSNLKFRKADGLGTAGFDLSNSGNNIHVAGSGFLPKNTGVQTLGLNSHKFKELWLSGSANVGGNLNVDGSLNINSKFQVQESKQGIRSQYGTVLIEADNSVLDLVSSSGDKWGSTINFIEGNGNTNTDIWSISRETTAGSGDSRLHFNFGTKNNHLNSSKFTIQKDGNVGIGTTNPKSRLLVSKGNSGGNPHGYSILTVENSNHSMISILTPNDKKAFFGFSDPQDNYVGGMQYEHADDRLVFRANNRNHDMVIDKTGYIGVGTLTPKDKLEVNGSLRFTAGGERGIYWGTTTQAKIKENWGIELNGDGRRPVQIPTSSLVVGYDQTSADTDKGVGNLFVKGNVGIGTTDPKNKLSVNGHIWAKEVKVSLKDAADWVFEEDYKLRPLKEVESYIKENKHLPEIPSAEEFREHDLKVSEMTNKLLQKIEELTLYVIEQNKRSEAQEARIKELEGKLVK